MKDIINKLLVVLKEVITSLRYLLRDNTPLPPVIDEVPQEVPDPQPKYDFSTYEKARLSVIRICGEEGASYEQTQLICQVIECESGFMRVAINQNKDGSKDVGICQYNTHWYIGEGKPIPDVETALNNPEFCVRVMVRVFLGKVKGYSKTDWVCFKSGKYKNYK